MKSSASGNFSTGPFSDRGRAPRVPILQNTRLYSRGGAELVEPDQAAIASIQDGSDGKVRYFPIDRQAFSESGARAITEPEFAELVTRPLVSELVARFPGKTLALRGVASSINGHMPPSNGDELDIWDITDTVSHGTEKPGAIFNVAVLDPEDPTSVHRVGQYANGVGFMKFAYIDGAEKAEATFPAILVYDCDGLQRAGHGYYSVAFREGYDPQNVLLGAYLLDCPGEPSR